MKEGWEVKKLGEVATFYNGYTPKEIELMNSGEIPYFKVSDMNHVLNSKYLNYTTLFLNKGCKTYPKNTIVFPKNGAAIATNKKRLLAQESVVDLNIGGVYLNTNELLYEYLYLYFLNIDFKVYTRRGAVPTLDIAELKSLKISIPPLPEQSRIVEELDQLSNIIEKKRQQLSELDNLAQSIFYDMFGDPVTNEKGWEVKSLKDIGSIITGNTPSTKDVDNYSSNDYCFVKPGDIGKDGITLINSTEYYVSEKAYLNSRKLPVGSVLVTCIGIIGKVGILLKNSICNQQINAILPNELICSEYCAFVIMLMRHKLEVIANAPVVPIINKGDFSNIRIPLPPLNLQQLFVQKIEAIEKEKELIKQSIKETEELFNSRMDYYFG